MKPIAILLFCMFFFKNIYAQQKKLSVKTEAAFYEMEQENPKLIKLKIINNYKEDIEVLNIFNSSESTEKLQIRTNAIICFKKGKKRKKFKCEPDISPLGGFKSRWVSEKSIDVNTGIVTGCLPVKGLYKIRLYLFYRLKGSISMEVAYSNWFKVAIN